MSRASSSLAGRVYQDPFNGFYYRFERVESTLYLVEYTYSTQTAFERWPLDASMSSIALEDGEVVSQISTPRMILSEGADFLVAKVRRPPITCSEAEPPSMSIRELFSVFSKGQQMLYNYSRAYFLFYDTFASFTGVITVLTDEYMVVSWSTAAASHADGSKCTFATGFTYPCLRVDAMPAVKMRLLETLARTAQTVLNPILYVLALSAVLRHVSRTLARVMKPLTWFNLLVLLWEAVHALSLSNNDIVFNPAVQHATLWYMHVALLQSRSHDRLIRRFATLLECWSVVVIVRGVAIVMHGVATDTSGQLTIAFEGTSALLMWLAAPFVFARTARL